VSLTRYAAITVLLLNIMLLSSAADTGTDLHGYVPPIVENHLDDGGIVLEKPTALPPQRITGGLPLAVKQYVPSQEPYPEGMWPNRTNVDFKVEVFLWGYDLTELEWIHIFLNVTEPSREILVDEKNESITTGGTLAHEYVPVPTQGFPDALVEYYRVWTGLLGSDKPISECH